MDEKRKDGYIAGLLFLIAFAIFLVSAINNGMNTSGLIIWVITIILGGLGFGSLWKPDSVGAVALQLLKYFSQSEEKSDSHDKQVQKNPLGFK
jgi:hypothetical protein